MALSFDNEQLEIECPKCGKKIKKPGRWFKQKNRQCPWCGDELAMDQIGDALQKAEEGLVEAQRRLADAFQRLGRRLKGE
jgi:peptide subunit release factor 1 (eRF1)